MMTDAPNGSVSAASGRLDLSENLLAQVEGIETLIPSVEAFNGYVASVCGEMRRWQATFVKTTEEAKQLRDSLEAKELLCASLSKELEETKACIARIAKEFCIPHEKVRAIMQRSAAEESPASLVLSAADLSCASTDTSLGISMYSTLESSVNSSNSFSTTPSDLAAAAKPDNVVLYLRKELSRLRDRLQGVIEINLNWKKEYTEMVAKKDSKIAELESRIEHVKESGDLTDDVRRGVVAAEAAASNAKRERDDACEQLHAVKAQLASVQLELEGSRQQLNSVLDRHEQEDRITTDNVERLKQRMRDVSAAKRQLEVDAQSVRNEIETLRRQNQSYESKLSNLRQGLHSLMFQDEPAQSGRQPKEAGGGRRGQKSASSAHAKGSGLVPRGVQNFELPSDVAIDETREEN